MPVFKGNTTGSILMVAKDIVSEIVSFSLVNKTAGSITVNVYIRDEDNNDIAVIPYNFSLAVGEAYISDVKRKMLGNTSVYIVVSGSCDYYFTIE